MIEERHAELRCIFQKRLVLCGLRVVHDIWDWRERWANVQGGNEAAARGGRGRCCSVECLSKWHPTAREHEPGPEGTVPVHRCAKLERSSEKCKVHCRQT